METRKRRQKIAENTKKQAFTNVSDTAEDVADNQFEVDVELEVKDEPVSSSDTDDTSQDEETMSTDSGGIGGGLMLDMLAQVASDRLEKQPGSKKKAKSSAKSVPVSGRRNPQTQRHLTLEQIKGLSDKLLVKMFADTTADEMKKMYTFHCFLMPNKCKAQVTAFGNEFKAKLKMLEHLKRHLRQLTDLEEESGNDCFVAEPIPARKKRKAAEKKKSKPCLKIRKYNKVKEKDRNVIVGSYVPIGPSTTGLPTTSISGDDLTDLLVPQAQVDKAKFNLLKAKANFNTLQNAANLTTSTTPPNKGMIHVADEITEQGFLVQPGPSTLTPDSVEVVVKSEEVLEDESTPSTSTQKTIKGKTSTMDLSMRKYHNMDVAITGAYGVMDESELFIMDLLRRSQPHKDHCYSNIFGKKCWILGKEDEDGEDGEGTELGKTSRTSGVCANYTAPENVTMIPVKPEDIKTELVEQNPEDLGTGYLADIKFPIVRLSKEQQEALAVERLQGLAEKTMNGNPVREIKPRKRRENSRSLYPPMPRTDPRLTARIDFIDEREDGDFDEADLDDPTGPRIIKSMRYWNRKPATDEGANPPEIDKILGERKLALKYIRELKMKKRDGSMLKCKICKGKYFTATATLLYHYRSHAGIKPFVCLICNTTFTRQHSLNYHMLIHNNQSRFTCKDCGRKFRHPSHFKEHLRRHTGETPYHCRDCPLRFKTRNTYKRHLKTRHGKLLTAAGIKTMSQAQMLKERIKVARIESGPDTGLYHFEISQPREDGEEDVEEDGPLVAEPVDDEQVLEELAEIVHSEETVMDSGQVVQVCEVNRTQKTPSAKTTANQGGKRAKSGKASSTQSRRGRKANTTTTSQSQKSSDSQGYQVDGVTIQHQPIYCASDITYTPASTANSQTYESRQSTRTHSYGTRGDGVTITHGFEMEVEVPSTSQHYETISTEQGYPSTSQSQQEGMVEYQAEGVGAGETWEEEVETGGEGQPYRETTLQETNRLLQFCHQVTSEMESVVSTIP